MANYVLIHGGDQDSHIWDNVAQLLTQNNHSVYCPTMTSVKEATLHYNITEIIDYIQSKQLDNFILVGHSYGGFVITGVANQLSDKISALIFVDSLIPINGKSLYDIAVNYAVHYESLGLTPDPAVMSKISFDSKKVFSKPKIYVHCLQSEFVEITNPIYEKLKHSKNQWILFCLDTTHSCMITQPKELSIILVGAQLTI
jgi:pimeloyl-ACP methyl ester carboxylesterase